jgi:cysteine sulfinate desulfinase/cysteine desulfurase-like protein
VIYLDHNATTPILPEVFEAMKPESAASRQMIRFSLDATNTATDIEKVLSRVEAAVKLLRG